MHPSNIAKYPFSCSSSHTPQDAIRRVKETTTKDPYNSRIPQILVLVKHQSQQALSSSDDGRGALEDCYRNPYKYPTRQPLNKKREETYTNKKKQRTK